MSGDIANDMFKEMGVNPDQLQLQQQQYPSQFDMKQLSSEQQMLLAQQQNQQYQLYQQQMMQQQQQQQQPYQQQQYAPEQHYNNESDNESELELPIDPITGRLKNFSILEQFKAPLLVVLVFFVLSLPVVCKAFNDVLANYLGNDSYYLLLIRGLCAGILFYIGNLLLQ